MNNVSNRVKSHVIVDKSEKERKNERETKREREKFVIVERVEFIASGI